MGVPTASIRERKTIYHHGVLSIFLLTGCAILHGYLFGLFFLTPGIKEGNFSKAGCQSATSLFPNDFFTFWDILRVQS